MRLRDRLTEDFNARVNQLHRLVDLGFPEFTRYVKSLDSELASAILHEYPTAQAFVGVSAKRLAKLCYDGRHKVGPELAAERELSHGGWATIVSARNVVEARVLVTDRMPALKVQGKVIHQIGLPYHWGPNGYSTGDSANDLMSIALDPNVHIQEVKAITADIRPGRRPRGPERMELVREYRRRARITEQTGV